MCDRRVVELIKHHVGEFFVACHFKNVDDDIEWALLGFMALMWIVVGVFNGTNWRVFAVCGISLGVLEGI